MGRSLAGELPTAADEIWRYSRIDELDLGAFPLIAPAPAPAPPAADAVTGGRIPVVAAVGRRAALVETVNGRIGTVELSDEAVAAGVTVGPAGEDDDGLV